MPIEEAARLDGSSELKILWRICLPQMRAGIAATAIIAFVFTWNDFLFSLLLTSVDTRTVPVAMTRVVGADVGVDWGVFAAIGTIYLLPVLLIAFFLQGPVACAARHSARCRDSDRACGDASDVRPRPSHCE